MLVKFGKFEFSKYLACISHTPLCSSTKNFFRLYSEGRDHVKKKDVSFESIKSVYDPKTVGSEWYEWWESKGYFTPSSEKKMFTMLLPPPNVTGTLHLGHALTVVIQDIYVRWLRMKGENVLWIPGFDHAGIATQVVVEKYLRNFLNVTKYDLGRKEFLSKIFEWKVEKENIITEQLKLLGASVDWSRKYFTMDECNSRAVSAAFAELYNKGLIYRYDGLINWSCYLNSSLSDIEIEWRKIDKPSKINIPGYRKPIEFGYMYKFSYKICDSNEGEEIVIGTTRPETMLGDTAIAVHPEDTRYSHLRNKFVWHPFRCCKIPIVFDRAVSPEMGTGAVKITPAHCHQDLEIAKRHDLEILDVFDEYGLVKEKNCYTHFQGLKRFDLKEKILNELQNLGVYKDREKYSTLIPFCSRSGDVIEYIRRPQWFLKCSDIMKKVKDAIVNNEITIEPEYCKNILFEWFRQRKDWNLSRQLWWGHRIPMYECETDGKKIWVCAMSLSEAEELASKELGTAPVNIKITQDCDVFDTWFSSGLLPLSTSGWPDNTVAGNRLNLMETGIDIVFFWVTRMLMLGIELTGQVPFSRVILHGMICDAYGRKMSKSMGNVILPEYIINGAALDDLKAQIDKNFQMGLLSADEAKLSSEGLRKMFPSGIPECGADALRLTLCNDEIKGDQVGFDIDLCKANKFFCNKMWQAMIFLHRCIEKKSDVSVKMNNRNYTLFDKWILSSLGSVVDSVNKDIESFEYHMAVRALKDFFVKYFCGIYIENVKLVLASDSDEAAENVIAVLFNCMETSLRLFSPFIPFVTEELYHCLPKLKDFSPLESVTVAKYPDSDTWHQYRNVEIDNLMSKYVKILNSIRSIRNNFRLSNQRLKVLINCPAESKDIFSDVLLKFLKKHSSVQEISQAGDEIPQRNVIVQNIEDCTVYLYHEYTRRALEEIFGPALMKEKKLKESLERLNSTISGPNYESDASAEVKRKNSLTLISVTEELRKIKQVKDVIEKAH